jgi:hypothetical protein
MFYNDSSLPSTLKPPKYFEIKVNIVISANLECLSTESITRTHYSDFKPTSLCSFSCVLSGEATNTNFIVFDLTRPGLEPTIYLTRGEHAEQRLVGLKSE